MDPNKIKDSIQAVIDALTPLAAKMQVPLEKLFQWALRENYVNAVQSGIWLLAASAVIYAYYRFLKWGLVKEDGSSYIRIYRRDLEDWGFFGGFVTAVCIVVFLMSLSDIAARLINPEYHAILDVVKEIKGDS